MPSLSEILNDPNYVNANEETKAAIFTKYAPLDENYTQANAATQAAIRGRFGVEGQPGIGAQGGFDTALYSGYQGLKGGLAGLAGRLGIMDVEKAKQIQEETEEKGKKAFKPTEGGWTTDFTGKFAETLGQSVPYMIAPIAAAGVATVAGAPGALATGISGLASAIQFAGSNLQRQQEQGIALEDTNLTGAIATAIPQAALETLSFRMIPGVQRLFGKAGKEITEAQAAEIAKQGIVRSTAAYGAQGARTGGVEGMTEVGQQFLERLQAGLTLGDQDAINEFVESFIGGAVLGGTLAIPGTAMRRDQARQMAAQAPQAPEAPVAGTETAEAPVAPAVEEVTAPEGAPSDIGVDQVAMEEEWLRSQGELPAVEPVAEPVAQPAQIAQEEDVQATPPAEPVSEPPSAPDAQPAQIAQEENVQPSAEDIVPLDDKGEPVKTPESIVPPKAPEVIDPNIEAQLAAEPFDADLAIPTDAQGNPIPPEPKVKQVRQPKAPVAPRVYFGMDQEGNAGVPLDDGGIPFRTQKDAQAAKKLQPGMTIVKRKDGFVLAEKTEKQIAADKLKAQRLKAGPQGILSAHEFIASLGGLNKKEAPEIDKDSAKSNLRFGNKYLYAKKGGLSAADAAEALKEAGYITDEDNNSAYTVIARSLNEPIYSIYDADAIAEQKFAERAEEDAANFVAKQKAAEEEVVDLGREAAEFQDYMAVELEFGDPRQTMLDAGYLDRELAMVRFTQASPELQAEVAALQSMLEAQGIDANEIYGDLAEATAGNVTSRDYYERAKARIQEAIQAEQRGDGDVGKADADKGAAAKKQEVKKPVENDILKIAEKADIPPVLQAPADFVLKKGRIEQVVLAARALEEGKITKAEYDKYVDYYAPIATVGTPEAPLSKDGMERVLKSNQVDKINPEVKDGTRVGLRMDINALKRAQQLSEKTGDKINGSVVSIHEGSTKAKTGKIIGYSGAASIKNARFEIRSEQAAFDIAQGVDDKSPQQTIEGEWVNISPEEAYSRVKSLLKDPSWAQVSLDPLRHSFFYDRSNKRPVVSADEILQVGRFVLAKNVKYAERDEFLYSIGEFKQAPDTKAFKDWFGDSKVVDEDGKPLLMYHATESEFSEFDTKRRAIAGEGSFFSAEPLESFASGEGGNIMPVYLSLKNPKVIKMGRDNDDILKAKFIREGYDGVILTWDDRILTAVAFYPEQIKSQFNQGTFSKDTGNISESIQNATEADIQNVQRVVNYYPGSRVAFQDGDVALLVVNSRANGDPMYFATKGAKVMQDRNGDAILLDKLASVNTIFTQVELDKLVQARDTIETEEAAKFAKDPYIKFTGDVAYSPSITPATRKLFEEWKKLLKLNQNIYLATNQDVLANADKYTGPQRRIPYAAARGNPGITQGMSDGTRYILLDGTQSEDSLVEILAHEMGHAHQFEVFDNAPAEIKAKVNAAFDQWLKSIQGKNARDFIDSLRAKETAATTNIPNPNMPATSVENYHAYWTTFKEWYADQTARWATTDEKPMTAVDKFFAKVAETLRNFFNTAKSKGFLPDQTFATYMNDITAPAFLAAQPSLPASVDGQLPLFSQNQLGPKAPWVDPEITWKDTVIRKAADRHNDLKTVQKAITEQVGNLRGNVNAYQIQDLAHGRIQTQTADFLDFEFVPILKEMQEKGITDPELTKYLLARHAEEANKVIAERNKNDPLMQDGGSGMDTDVANKYLASLAPAKKAALESIAKKVDNILALTREMLETNGIISKEEREGWESMFQHYVPLQREQSDYALPSNSYKSVGKFSKSRTGSTQKSVIDILANVGINREVAIVRIEKERVKRAVYGLAVTNPNPEIWKAVSPDAVKNKTVLAQELREMGISPADVANILDEPTTRYFNKETGQVESRVDTMKRYADFVLPVKINGKDRFIFFNPQNPRAMAMVTALKDMDVQALEGAIASVANVTRFFAAVNTQYNLVFGLWNFARDLQGSMFNLTTTDIADKKAEVAKGSMKALPEIYKALRERNAGETPSDTKDGSWHDFISHGGKVGYRDQFAKVKESTTLVDREFAKLNRGNAKKAAYALLNWVSNVNDVMENAVRLSSYRVALDKYKSEAKGKISDAQLEEMKAKAAEIAKNITVNFNTKGSSTGMIGALYAFTNASIRGTARLAETVDPRTSRGRKIMGSLVALGAVQAVALAMAGFDDDEPSEFIKQKSLVIPLSFLGLEGKKYFMIPMPYGLNVFPNLGRLMVEGGMSISKGRGVKDQVANTIGMLFTAFNPIGGGAGALAFSPTALDPAIAIIQNRDAFDRPITREDRSTKPTPGYLRSRDQSASVSQFIAEFLNTITGGTAYTKGLVSPTADQINYLAEQVGGGVYREGSRAVKYAADKATGEKTPDYRIPLAGKIVGNLDSPAAISQKFYSNVIRMSEHEDEIKGRQSKRESPTQYMKDNPSAFLWRQANTLENELSKINRRRRELIAKDAPKDQIKKLEDQRTRMMKQFNDKVRKYD
jgi:hypothetical protein